MIETGKTYVVMGLLDPESLAYTIGRTIQRLGGKVVFTIQNELLKKRYLDSNPKLTAQERSAMDYRFCDVSVGDGVRVNAVSARPLSTTASSKIPGFDKLVGMWKTSSVLLWDPVKDKQAVADAVVFLLGPQSARITGQILAVDGGTTIVGGTLLDYEKPTSD